MGVAGGLGARMVHRLSTAGAVLAIIAASLIGLHDWADEAATHSATADGSTGQHLPTA